MAHKITYLCSECKNEWLGNSSKEQPKECSFCGRLKFIKVITTSVLQKKAATKCDGLIKFNY